MLKSVVLPAPLGPITETIERSGMSIDTPPTAIRPPNLLTTFSTRMIAGATGVGARRHIATPPALGSLQLEDARVHLAREFDPSSPLGEQALRAQNHHDHQQEAEDPDVEVGQVEVEPEGRAAGC